MPLFLPAAVSLVLLEIGLKGTGDLGVLALVVLLSVLAWVLARNVKRGVHALYKNAD